MKLWIRSQRLENGIGIGDEGLGSRLGSVQVLHNQVGRGGWLGLEGSNCPLLMIFILIVTLLAHTNLSFKEPFIAGLSLVGLSNR